MNPGPETTDFISKPEKDYNYGSIGIKLEEAIEHLQALLEDAKRENLTEYSYTRRLAHAITDLNEGYNRRYKIEKRKDWPDTGKYEDDKLPWEILEEWAKVNKWSLKTVSDFTFKKNLISSHKASTGEKK